MGAIVWPAFGLFHFLGGALLIVAAFAAERILGGPYDGPSDTGGQQ